MNQLDMAILNLAVNARNAMPDGGTLRIAANVRTANRGNKLGVGPGTYVCISVADTGVGMDAATLTRAVEPVFSSKGVSKGTGLGLSMVHGLAAQLGGAVHLASMSCRLYWIRYRASRSPPARGDPRKSRGSLYQQ